MRVAATGAAAQPVVAAGAAPSDLYQNVVPVSLSIVMTPFGLVMIDSGVNSVTPLTVTPCTAGFMPRCPSSAAFHWSSNPGFESVSTEMLGSDRIQLVRWASPSDVGHSLPTLRPWAN